MNENRREPLPPNGNGYYSSLRLALRHGATVARGAAFDQTLETYAQVFLAQCFSHAFNQCQTNEETKRLADLWQSITGEKK